MGILGNDKKTIVRDLLEKIKKLVTPEEVEEDIIQSLKLKWLKERSLTLIQLLEAHTKQENDIRKIKPDIEHFSEDGTPTNVSFSKGQLEALKKAKERLDKMHNAFVKGLAGDMKDAKEIVQSFGKDKGGGGKESSSGDS